MEYNYAPSSSSSSSSSSSDSDKNILEFCTDYFLQPSSIDPIIPYILEEAENSQKTNSQKPRKKRIVKPRLIEEGAARLHMDYFASVPVYPEREFRLRFRMHRALFVRIADEVIEKCSFFRQKPDAAHRVGINSYQKITAAMRLMAYDASADSLEEYLRISASTSMQCLKKFSRAIVNIFSRVYLREPNEEDVRKLNQVNTSRGFPGMIGSIDCMHWSWKNCPTAWAGQYQSGHNKESSIVLQAVASKNLWIWHAYFGASGCNNDINVLEESHLFDSLLECEAPTCNYQVNGHQYNMGYYLADGIYPPWACFVKTIPNPLSQKQKTFAQYQEGVRKDVERAFGVLQSRWHILRGSARLWDQEDLKYIMLACIIMHNMIVEDENEQELVSTNFPMAGSDNPPPPLSPLPNPALNPFQSTRVSLRNKQMHKQLQEDLIEHIWQFHGAN